MNHKVHKDHKEEWITIQVVRSFNSAVRLIPYERIERSRGTLSLALHALPKTPSLEFEMHAEGAFLSTSVVITT